MTGFDEGWGPRGRAPTRPQRSLLCRLPGCRPAQDRVARASERMCTGLADRTYLPCVVCEAQARCGSAEPRQRGATIPCSGSHLAGSSSPQGARQRAQQPTWTACFTFWRRGGSSLFIDEQLLCRRACMAAWRWPDWAVGWALGGRQGVRSWTWPHASPGKFRAPILSLHPFRRLIRQGHCRLLGPLPARVLPSCVSRVARVSCRPHSGGH